MKRVERSAYWKQLVDEQRASGINAPIFCREHNLKNSQFYRWRRKFQNMSYERSSTQFIQLIPGTVNQGSGITIRISDNLCIEVERGFDPVTLRTAVETLSCME